MDDIKWADPPPAKGRFGDAGSRERFVTALKSRKGVWAQYRPDRRHSAGVAPTMRKAFPGLEVTQRTRPDGMYDVFARWVGNGDGETP